MRDSFLDWISQKRVDKGLIDEIFNELESYCKNACKLQISLFNLSDPVALCFAESIAKSGGFDSQYHHGDQAVKALKLYKGFLNTQPLFKDSPWWKKEVAKNVESGLCLLILKEDQDWLCTKPKKFFYKSRARSISSWRSLYNNLCNLLYSDFPDVFSGFIGKSFSHGTSPDIVDNKGIKLLRSLGKVGKSLYMELDFSPKEIVERIFILLELCNISPLELPILYEIDSNKSSAVAAGAIAGKDGKSKPADADLLEKSDIATASDAKNDTIGKELSSMKQAEDDSDSENSKSNAIELRLFDLEAGEAAGFAQPVMFSLSDSKNTEVKDWRDLYLEVVRQVYRRRPRIKNNLKGINFIDTSNDGPTDYKIDDNLFLSLNISDEEMVRRIKVILAFAGIPCSELQIWCVNGVKPKAAVPSKDQSTAKQDELEVDFYSDRNMDGTRPISCSFWGRDARRISNWNVLYAYVIKTLHSWKPSILKEYVGRSLVGEDSADITDWESKSDNAFLIRNDLYLEINQRITEKIRRIRALLDIYGLDYSALSIKYSDIQFTRSLNKPKSIKKEKDVVERKVGAVTKPSSGKGKDFLDTPSRKREVADIQESVISEKPATEMILADFSSDVDLTSTVPCSFVVYGKERKIIQHWNLLYVEAVKALYDGFPELFQGLKGKSLTGTETPDFADEKGIGELAVPYLVADDIYLEANNTPAEKIKRLGCLLGICKIEPEDFQIWYIHKGDESNPMDLSGTPNPQVVPAEDKLVSLIIDQFTKGIRHDGIGLKRLRNAYSKANNGEELPEGFDLQVFLNSNCVFCNDAYYYLTEETTEKVKAKVEKLVNDGNNIFYYKELYDSFSDFFLDIHIYSSDLLKAMLKVIFDKFEFREDYFVTSRARNLESELESCFDNHACRSYSQLFNALPYVPDQTIKEEVAGNKSFINVRNNEFTLEKKVITDDIEGETFLRKVGNAVSEKGFAKITDFVFPKGEDSNPDLTDSALRVVYFRRYLSASYDKKNNYIYPKGGSQNNTSLYRSLCNSKNAISRNELNDYEQEMSGEVKDVAYKIACAEMVRIDSDHFVSKDSIEFDVEAIDSALDSLSGGKVMPLKAIKNFYLFSNTKYPWNHFLLESYCRHFSKRYSFGSKVINDSKIGSIYPGRERDYMDVLADAVKEAGITLDDKIVGDFLVEYGFISKRNKKLIQEVTTKAQAI